MENLNKNVSARKRGRVPGSIKAIKVENKENDDTIQEIKVNAPQEEAQAQNSVKSKRPKRTPLHKQRILVASPREGYERRWVVEKPGRVQAFVEAGWNIVHKSVDECRDERAQNASQMGTSCRVVVNPNSREGDQTAVLMEIPKEWYNEDQLAKRELIKQREAALDPKSKKEKGFYGSMTIDRKN